jgi:hypothetical protein
MAVDEYEALHETIEHRTGIDWQVLYLPLLAVIALAWLGTLQSLSDVPFAQAMLVAGAGLWIAAQVLEHFEWTGDGSIPVRWYTPMMIVEEIGEMLGTLAFGTALLAALRRWATASATGSGAAPRTARPVTPDAGDQPSASTQRAR